MSTPAQIAGKVVVFTGNESKNWNDSTVQQTAQYIRSLGADTICMKYADGGISYHSPQTMERFHTLANREGAGLLGFQYCYGPAFAMPKQIQDEARIANNMAGYIPMVILDMEIEYDSKTDPAKQFRDLLTLVPAGKLAITTWANPVRHNWVGIIEAFNQRQNMIWIPQKYTSFLDTQPEPGMNIIWPAIDLSNEFGPNDPLAIIESDKPQSAWVWNIPLAQRYTYCAQRLRDIAHFMHNGDIPDSPIPAIPTAIPVTRWPKKYGCLWDFAQLWHTSVEAVYQRNQEAIESAAKAHGLDNSQHGGIIFEGTTIQKP